MSSPPPVNDDDGPGGLEADAPSPAAPAESVVTLDGNRMPARWPTRFRHYRRAGSHRFHACADGPSFVGDGNNLMLGGEMEPVTNQVTTPPGNSRHSAT